MVWWYDCVKGCALLVVDHVNGGWSCYIFGLVCWWFGIAILICWYIDLDILNKVWIIKINDKKQYKTIKNNKK